MKDNTKNGFIAMFVTFGILITIAVFLAFDGGGKNKSEDIKCNKECIEMINQLLREEKNKK